MTYRKNEYILKIEKEVGRAINQYSLIKEGDNIAVALSGGVDSLVLLETLARRRARIPISYNIHAVHVIIKNIGYSSDIDFLEKFCKDLYVPLTVLETTVDLSLDKDKSVCFICSWHRRKMLFQFAEDTNCNKIAFGHHLEDAIETLFMNMAYNGCISSMPPALSMFNGKLDIIRPMLLLDKEDINKYAQIREFPENESPCPYSYDNKRESIRKIISSLAPDKKTRKNIFKSMSNIHSLYLPPKI